MKRLVLLSLVLAGCQFGSEGAGPPDRDLSEAAADSVKRVRYLDWPAREWLKPERLCTLHLVAPFVEVKTFWHPVAP